MSDISTSLTDNSFMNSFFNLSNNQIQKCNMFTFKLILLIMFVLIVLSSLFASVWGPKSEDVKKNVENFSNDIMYSYKDAIHSNYSNYQSAELTAPDTADGNPSNKLFGLANRTIIMNGNDKNMYFNIYCNLFIINGNPFGERSINITSVINQNYFVHLSNSDGEKMLLGELYKDGDGIYKLKMDIKDQKEIEKIFSYNQVHIIYEDTIILTGKFTLR